MKLLITRLVGIGSIFVLILIVNSCGPMIHITELKQDYNFACKQEIGVYIIPSERTDLNKIYSNVLQLDFISKGYSVKDINLLLSKYSDSIIVTNPKKIIDSLRQREYLKTNDVFIIAKLKWDSAFVATELEEGIDRIYYGYNVMELSTDLVMYDRLLKNPIFSFSAVDTAKLYASQTKNYYIIKDPNWIIAGRQLLNNLNQIPKCSYLQNSEAIKKIRVSFWADKSYRDTFSKEWKERLNRIVVLANDILRIQLGIELDIYTLNKWDSEFETSLDQTFQKLKQKPVSYTNVIRLGVTFDPNLANNVTDRSHLGLAEPLGIVAVMTGQPSFPGMRYWNPIEEAITLVHEIAHLFGGIHIPDETTIMYPESGSLSFRFDEANQRIVKAMCENFLEIDEKQRTQNYIHTLIDVNENHFENNLPILLNIAEQIFSRSNHKLNLLSNKEAFNKEIMDLVNDSVYALAVMGVTEYKLKHWEQSIELISDALKLKPNFAEAHWYLSLALEKIGDFKEADKQKKMAKPFRNTWILDEKKIF